MRQEKKAGLTDCLNYLATGVCVLSISDSVSLGKGIVLVRRQPLTICVAIDRNKVFREVLEKNERFEVLILSYTQQELARSLLAEERGSKEKEVPLNLSRELLSNRELVAAFECEKINCINVFDYTLITAEVLKGTVNSTKAPIVYYGDKLVGLD